MTQSDFLRYIKENYEYEIYDDEKELIIYIQLARLMRLMAARTYWQKKKLVHYCLKKQEGNAKHSKKSLERKDISEIDDLLSENNATHYGLFCSNDLTPDTVDRLNTKNSKTNGSIKFYGKRELETLLNQFPKLIQIYKLLG